MGAGGHTRSALNLVKTLWDKHEIAIYDDTFSEAISENIEDIPLVGNLNDITSFQKVFLSIGDNNKRGLLFKEFYQQIDRRNMVHPYSFCEFSAKLGIANQIFAFAYLNSGVKIGDNNIINSAAVIEHESVVGNHNHISVGAKICGRVKIGDYCLVGAGAVIKEKISIGNHIVIGAGSVVVNDLNEAGVYVGIPAKKLR